MLGVMLQLFQMIVMNVLNQANQRDSARWWSLLVMKIAGRASNMWITSPCWRSTYGNQKIKRRNILSQQVFLYDVLLILCKKYYKRLLRQNIQFFSDLITAVRDLFWHIPPNHDKFSLHGTNLPIFFKPLIDFNNPKRYKNKPGNIYSKNLF